MAHRTDVVGDRGLNYWVAMVLGWVLVAVGLIGFVWDPVFGLFEVGPLHNVIHLVSGAALLGAAYAANGLYARHVNLTLGIVYAIVALWGFFALDSLQAIIQTNMADNWLHTLLAVVLIGVGFAQRTETTRPGTMTPP